MTKIRIDGLNPFCVVAATSSGPSAAGAAVIGGTGGGWGWSQRTDCSPGQSPGRDALPVVLPAADQRSHVARTLATSESNVPETMAARASTINPST